MSFGSGIKCGSLRSVCKWLVCHSHAFTLQLFCWCNLILLQQSYSFEFWMPFPVSSGCPWLVFWYLKWLCSLAFPGFPGALETLHVENDKGYCDFSVSYFLFPLQCVILSSKQCGWLRWPSSSASWGNWGWPKHFDIKKWLFLPQIFSGTLFSTM